MGFVYVQVAVPGPSRPDQEERLKLMVDTGATLSVIPTTVLSRLNVEPEGSQNFRGFGGVVTREIGGLRMTYDGATALITVVFGGQDDPPIMGVTALESLGYQVDPVEGKLVKSEMLLLQAG